MISLALFLQEIGEAENWIRDMGNPQVNTDGAILHNIGLIVIGIGLIFHFLYILQQLRDKFFTLALIGTISSIIGSVGVLLAGIMNPTVGSLHDIWTNIGLGGILIGHVFYTGIFLYSHLNGLKRHPSIKSMIITNAPIILFVVLIFVYYGGETLDAGMAAVVQFVAYFCALFFVLGDFVGLPDKRP